MRYDTHENFKADVMKYQDQHVSDLLNAPSESLQSFATLSAYAHDYASNGAYREAFMFSERALTAYETESGSIDSPEYAALRRLRHQLLRDHLDLIVGASWPLLDKMWPPVFKNGHIREVSWTITPDNLESLAPAVRSEDCRRLRFLNIQIMTQPDEVLCHLGELDFSPLRVLNLHFKQNPPPDAYQTFWNKAAQTAHALDSLTISMTRHTDIHAEICLSHLHALEALNLISSDRDGMHEKICEIIADGPISQTLRTLALVGTSIGDSGLMTLLQNENFERLQMLILRDGILTNAAADMILASELPQLRTIDIRYNQIDPAGLSKLDRISHIQMLTDHQNCRPDNA